MRVLDVWVALALVFNTVSAGVADITSAALRVSSPFLGRVGASVAIGTVAAELRDIASKTPARAAQQTDSSWVGGEGFQAIPTTFPLPNEVALAHIQVAHPGDTLTITYDASFSGAGNASFYTYCNGSLFNGPGVAAGTNQSVSITVPATTCANVSTIDVHLSNQYNSSVFTVSYVVRFNGTIASDTLVSAQTVPPGLPPSTTGTAASRDPVQTNTGNY